MVEIEEIAEQSQFDEAIKGKVTLVDFFAEWHMQCLTQEPIIEEIFEKFKDKIKFCRVNVEDNYEVVSKFKVSNLPALVLFKEGIEVCRMCGCKHQFEIEKKIEEMLR
ncbi:MAG: thioredoxin family protein [Nanoarchaeota archaeon]|nr:thioredoxin family protein [Nanoarchaeota archaeon]